MAHKPTINSWRNTIHEEVRIGCMHTAQHIRPLNYHTCPPLPASHQGLTPHSATGSPTGRPERSHFTILPATLTPADLGGVPSASTAFTFRLNLNGHLQGSTHTVREDASHRYHNNLRASPPLWLASKLHKPHTNNVLPQGRTDRCSLKP